MTRDIADSEPESTLPYRVLKRLHYGVVEPIRSGQRRFDVVRGILMSELITGRWVRVSPRRRLWLWRHGFVSEADVLFDIDERNVDRYLSDYDRGFAGDVNGEWRYVLDNKLAFFRVLESAFDCHATVYGLLDDGRWKTVTPLGTPNDGDGTSAGSETSSPAGRGTAASPRLFERLSTDGTLVLKPVFGGQGKEVHVVELAGDGYRLDGEPIERDALARFVDGRSEYVVMAFARQADYAAEMFPGATNTIRLITMLDGEGEPFVAAAVHRVGTAESAPVDNWSRGGMSADLDIETGELGRAARWSSDSLEELTWHETHPDTGARITGRTVPGWSAIHERVLDLADWFSMTPYVGWDVVVTDPGELAVIEANAGPGSDALQVHRPLLVDDRIRRFFERHGIV